MPPKNSRAPARTAKPKQTVTSKTNGSKKTAKTQDRLELEGERDQGRQTSEEARKQQQRIVDVFRRALSDVLFSDNLTATMQAVKQALFDRDFARAFGNPEYLAVYAARWSPTRALCYTTVLSGIWEHLESISQPIQVPAPSQEDDENGNNKSEPKDSVQTHQLKVFSIGGGAAELVSLAGFLSQCPSPMLSGHITLLDSGPWADVITQLYPSLTTPPPISKYASAAAKLANAAIVSPSRFSHAFLQEDVLTMDQPRLTSILGNAPLLITLLFTLNELFTASGIGKTTKLLLDITSVVPFGSLLLVVDSPGSYSETSVGKEAKRYPMQWLLDRVLMGTRREPIAGRRWKKLEGKDSVWFRLAEGLDYPIQLENMRYQMHLYRAEDASLESNSDDD
ncbi:uncharacterized protein CTHT_0066790 [Thermochaetoides thermophila DSM 1495]|uniref:25S rRNA (Uridine(2843)-N(3))-methyltransferase n=1 Tax=Chaetomium thermophilum (strain DSM 1495 / CBS 144.50 / IMI 039719) TaxID=759272 RepID=G0SGL8_CHATD|nr:hypothetical protein CTHT_0066790 [Thermochaetoides thermophila DSM 1495]EGS17357.1 hypothetical protein CTHT_0066790 [Thermochaetoides thermophila DSM 1495]